MSTFQAERRAMREDEKCRICGHQGVYAKHLCRKCYDRLRKNNWAESSPKTEAVRKRWIGKTANGWEVIEHMPKDKVLVRCQFCGRTKVVSKSGITKGSIRPCVCHIERLTPRTETQARIYSAVLHNKGNGSKAAKDLGLSRQAVFRVLETMRKNQYEE